MNDKINTKYHLSTSNHDKYNKELIELVFILFMLTKNNLKIEDLPGFFLAIVTIYLKQLLTTYQK